MFTERHNLGTGRPAQHAGRPGFSLVELLVAITIIIVVLSLVLVAVNAAGTGARKKAQSATVRSMGLAIEQFSQSFGTIPPLVQDGLQSSGGGAMTLPAVQLDRGGAIAAGDPVEIAPGNGLIRLAAVYNPAHLPNRRMLEGLPAVGGVPTDAQLLDRYRVGTQAWRDSNQRYSKYTLAYYLSGALPSAVDGVDGPGMVRPLGDGTFEGVKADSADPLEANGRSTSRDRYEPFFDSDRGSAKTVREYFDIDEYRENTGNADLEIADPSSQTDWRHVAIVDDGGKAYRYYRWEPLSASYGITARATYQLNIPYVLLDEAAVEALASADPVSAVSIDLTGGNASLRGARWAIVGAGPNGLFGTEPFELLRRRLDVPDTGSEESDYRALAKSDNLVEVGR